MDHLISRGGRQLQYLGLLRAKDSMPVPTDRPGHVSAPVITFWLEMNSNEGLNNVRRKFAKKVADINK